MLPDGSLSSKNPAGVQYYHNLIDALVAAGITPMVTLYHWDLPNELQKAGGWLVESIVPLFRDYADLCFSEYGDRVRMMVRDYAVLCLSEYVDKVRYGVGLC